MHENMTKKKPVEEQKKRGRKKIAIDYEKVENYAARMASYDEIADIMGVNTSTLERDPEFLRHHKKGMQKGRVALRSKQFELAMAGNPTMLVWLGKQVLGQRDKQDTEITGKDGGPIPIAPINVEQILGTEAYREYERKVFNAISGKPANIRA